MTPRHLEPQRRSTRLGRQLLDWSAVAYRWVDGLPWERLWLRPVLLVALLLLASSCGGALGSVAMLLGVPVEPWFWWGFALPVVAVTLFGLDALCGWLSALDRSGARWRTHR